jgi:hypothetical protein
MDSLFQNEIPLKKLLLPNPFLIGPILRILGNPENPVNRDASFPHEIGAFSFSFRVPGCYRF